MKLDINQDKDQQPDVTGNISKNKPAAPSGNSKNKKLTLIVIVLLLIIGTAVFVALRVLKNDNNSSSQSQTQSSKGPYSILMNVRINDTKFGLQTMNPVDGSFTAYDEEISLPQSIIAKSDGELRFVYQTTTENPEKYVHTVYYRDQGGSEKTFYTIESNKKERNGMRVFRWTADNSGSKIAIYQNTFDGGDGSVEELFLVDENGGKELLLTRKNTDQPWFPGYDHGVLTPGAFSTDNNVLYFEDHSCIECDGPPRANIFALDTKTKKLTKELANPDTNTAYGYWSKASIDKFFVTTDTSSALGPTLSYEQAAKEVMSLYLFNTKTTELKPIFKSQGAGQRFVKDVGVSDDEKTAYIVIKSLEKFDGPVTYPPEGGGSVYKYAIKDILAIDLESGVSSKLLLPEVETTTDVTFIRQYQGDLIYGLITMQQPFEEYSYTAPETLYILEKDQTTVRKLKTFKGGEFSIVDFIENK